ncbi:hypothetical protein [Mycobacterium scrofulaceum]|uniref:hypothetical protein n=1 Tax=Mycobacterium scrofulaceum TaxID=1783 RepID=UPI0013020A41|nr:hypothetical protein [Mycobacterium scrofulaceum]
MTYRMTGETPLVIVRDQDGELRYHSAGGPEIPWLSPQQAERYLELGLVEQVEEPMP